MPANPGSAAARAAITAHYVYAARYGYSDVVVQSDNLLRLAAYADRCQQPVSCHVATTPQGRQTSCADRLGNTVHRVSINEPHRELVIAAFGSVRLNDLAIHRRDVPLCGLEYGPEAREFLLASPLADPAGVTAAAHTAAANAETLLDAAGNVVSWIHQNVRYRRGFTSVHTTAPDVLETMSGVCQDMTHLGLAMLRALGIPARYVSGLLTRHPGETHAWLEFLHPQQGWLPADPTRGLLVDGGTDYLKFGVGRDYSEVPPVSGSFVSQGSGQLDFAAAEVFFDRETVSMEDALRLLEPLSPGPLSNDAGG